MKSSTTGFAFLLGNQGFRQNLGFQELGGPKIPPQKKKIPPTKAVVSLPASHRVERRRVLWGEGTAKKKFSRRVEREPPL